MAYLQPLFIYFRLLKQAPQSPQQIYVKNAHPVYDTEIRTHDLQNMSLLPYPLDAPFGLTLRPLDKTRTTGQSLSHCAANCGPIILLPMLSFTPDLEFFLYYFLYQEMILQTKFEHKFTLHSF